MSDPLKIVINDRLTDISELKVTELKSELKKRGISTAGVKQDLYEKLKAHLLQAATETEAAPAPPVQAATIQHHTPSPQKVVVINAAPAALTEAIIATGHSLQQTVAQEPVPIVQQQQESHKPVDSTNGVDQIKETTVATPVEPTTQIQQEVEKPNHEKVTQPEVAPVDQPSKETIPVVEEKAKEEEKPAPKEQPAAEAITLSEPATTSVTTKPNEEPVDEATEPAPLVVTASDSNTSTADQQVDGPKAVAATTPVGGRKRKWLGASGDAGAVLTANKSSVISSDTLKSYMPVNPLNNMNKEAETTVVETDHQSNSHPVVVDKHVVSERKVVESDQVEDAASKKSSEESMDHKKTSEEETTRSFNKQSSRTVIIDEATSELTTHEDTEQSGDKRQLVETSVLHVKNLTRPFTLNQLKELLSKHGRISKQGELEHFWIDSVKSHCYVAYDHVDEARQARAALNGTTWPSSNPKQLKIDFVSLNELLQHIAPTPHENGKESGVKITVSTKKVEEKTETTKKVQQNGDKSSSQDVKKSVREWDLPKLKRVNSRSRSRSPANDHVKSSRGENDKSRERARKDEVGAATGRESEKQETNNTLDDLFRKTTHTPYIYWLPLTEEQYALRLAEQQRRDAERVKRNEERRARELAEEAERAARREKREAERREMIERERLAREKRNREEEERRAKERERRREVDAKRGTAATGSSRRGRRSTSNSSRSSSSDSSSSSSSSGSSRSSRSSSRSSRSSSSSRSSRSSSSSSRSSRGGGRNRRSRSAGRGKHTRSSDDESNRKRLKSEKSGNEKTSSSRR